MPPIRVSPATNERVHSLHKITESLTPLATPISSLIPDPENARKHGDRSLESIKASLERYGQCKPVVVNRETGIILAGNGTYAAALMLGWTHIAVTMVEMDDIRAVGFALADNRTAELSEWDYQMVQVREKMLAEAGEEMVGWSDEELKILRTTDFINPPVGEAGGAGASTVEEVRSTLVERFVIPPFSVLDSRQGYWQKRKRLWLSLGIRSELGRGDNLIDVSATVAGITNPEEREKWNANRREEASSKHLAGDNETCPGGSARPSARLGEDGKTVRGDGKGRKLGTTFNSGGPGTLAGELADKEEKEKGKQEGAAHPLPGGGTGKNSAWMFKGDDGYKSLKVRGNPVSRGQDGVLTIRVDAGAYDQRRRLARQLKDSAETPEEADTAAVGQGVKLTGGPEAPGPGSSGTSIFDPVLCEIAYRWFSPPNAVVLDPFAGGSVRGIVASVLGRRYRGMDLAEAQINANREQGRTIIQEGLALQEVGEGEENSGNLNPYPIPEWVCGDSQGVSLSLPGEYDLVFSCPPYADLERYSDDPRDISAMDYDEFMVAYSRIIGRSCSMLKDNRFAVWVVGEVRDRKSGLYRGLIADTIRAFEQVGLGLYNDAVFITAAGSLPIRVGAQFTGSRKLGRTHQSMLVFVKGDPKLATRACGPVEMGNTEWMELIGVADEEVV